MSPPRHDTLYELHEVPDLRTPVMIVALDGWVDAGDVLAQAVGAVCANPAVLVAEFDTDLLVDYRSRRPDVHMENGITVSIRWPHIELYATSDLDGRDVVVLRGHEPDFRWRAFARQVLNLAQMLKVRLVVPLGGYPAATPHTRPVRLSATGTTPLVVEKVGAIEGSVDVPAGVQAAIERECAARGIPSVGLWAPVPHYVATEQYPAAAAALMETLHALAERRFDTEPLLEAAATTEARLDALMETSEEHATLVGRLEEHQDRLRNSMADLPSGEDLAAELQRYLQDPGDS